jgi:hypothetical protein
MKGYIVFVSQQIFPIVQGIAWAEEQNFDRVVLLCTPGSGEKSEKPAQRIKDLCKELQKSGIWREFRIDDPIVTDITPQAVTETIETLICQTPGEWVINTTGGLKLMSFGSANFAGKLEIQYAELSKGWYRISRGINGVLQADPWMEAPPRTITDNIPIKLLAEAQFPSDKYDVSVSDSSFLQPLVPKLTELIEDIATDGAWVRVFKSQALKPVSLSQTLEYFLYLMCYRLIMRSQDEPNIALNLTVTAKKEDGKPQGKQPLEADVVANFNGSLRFLEAKWDRPELPTLLKKLANLKELSGIGGSVGLYAPFIEAGEGDDALVATYQVAFWNKASRADLVPRLYDFLHGKGEWDRVGSGDPDLLALDTLFREKETQLFNQFEPMIATLNCEMKRHNWSYFRIGAMGVLLWRSLVDSRELMKAFAEAGFTLTATGQTTRKTNGQQSQGEAIPEKTAQVFICDDKDGKLCRWLDNVKGNIPKLTPEALRAALGEAVTESGV